MARHMHCPKCVRSSLTANRINDTEVVVDACAGCKGVWFDVDELNRVLPTASKDLQPPKEAKATGMTCPRCHIPLKAFFYPQTRVEIDMCEKCLGLWLYPDEFKEIKFIRGHLRKKGKLEAYAPVVGFKGDLLGWIDSAIDTLLKFE